MQQTFLPFPHTQKNIIHVLGVDRSDECRYMHRLPRRQVLGGSSFSLHGLPRWHVLGVDGADERGYMHQLRSLQHLSSWKLFSERLQVLCRVC